LATSAHTTHKDADPSQAWYDYTGGSKVPDGHYWKVIYDLGPCIAHYLEQALLACIVQGWCPSKFAFTFLEMYHLFAYF